MFRIRQCPCRFLCCLYRLPIHWLCITATKSLSNYHNYKNKDRWYSIDSRFNIFSIHILLPTRIEFIIIWTYRLPFYLIETQPFGKADPSNILALVGFILLRFIYVAQWFILPAILRFSNQYSHVTAQYSPMVFFKWYSWSNKLKHPVKIHWLNEFYCFLFPWFLVVVIVLTVRKIFSACFFDLSVGRINLGTFGAALTSSCSGVLGSSIPLSSCMSDSLFASQFSELSFGLSKSPILSSQFLVSRMLSAALSSSHTAGWRSILCIRRTFYSWLLPPRRFVAETAGGTGDLSDNEMQPHHHVECLTKMLWTCLQYLKFIQQLSFECFECEIPSL